MEIITETRCFVLTCHGMIPKNRVWAIDSHRPSSDSDFTKNRDKDSTESSGWTNFWIVESWKSYCSSTALHGFNYITRDNSSTVGKFGWTTIVLMALSGTIALLWISLSWNQDTTTVTVVESTHFATWNIPFPAVTICSFNKISKRKALEVAEMLKKPDNITTEELSLMFILTLDFAGNSQSEASKYSILSGILAENGLTALRLLQLVAPKCSDILLRCTWKGTQARCDTLFQSVNSTEGVCCAFNYHGERTNNYPRKLEYMIPKQPRRVTACGYQTGLTVILNPIIDDYFGTHISSYGFRVLIHDSYDYPDANAETKIVSWSTENFIRVTPESTYATSDVRRLNPKDRNCLLHDEKKLDLMQHYSYINCLTECRGRLIYETCGCIPLRYLNNGSFPSCNMDKVVCVVKNKKLFIGALPGINETTVEGQSIVNSPCQCLPDCELNQYPAEIATAVLDRRFSYNTLNLFKDLVLKDEVVLHVYFNDLVSTRYRKDIFQNWVGLLASLGGLMGLIMGFSIVTAFEFVYYFTLQPFFDYLSKKIVKSRNANCTE